MKRIFLTNLTYIFILSIIFKYVGKINSSVYSLVFSITLLIVYTLILAALNYKKRVVINILFITLSFIVVVANSLNMLIKGQIITVSQLSLAKELLGVSDMVLQYANVYSVSLLFIPIIWIVLTIKLFNIEQISINKKRLIHMVSIIVIANIIFYISNPLLYATVYNPNEYVENFGLASYYTRDLLPFTKNKLDYESSNVKAYENSSNIEMYGSMEYKKNVVFIVAESFSYAAIDEQITPTLNDMSQSGMLFENYYTLNNNTNASEFSILTSVPPPIDNSKVANYSESFETIPELFNNKGYCTFGIHANTESFYNRAELYPDLYGFDESIFTETKHFEYTGDWVRDEYTFSNTIDSVESKNCDKNFVYYMSTYGHANYSVDDRVGIEEDYNFVNSVYPDYDESHKTYMAAQMSLDRMLYDMKEYYKNRGELEETLFVVVGDHYPYSLGEVDHSYGESSQTYIDQSFTGEAFETYNVPLFIYDPAQKLDNRDEYVSNIDILPMISDLFALDYKISYGTSPFSNRHRNLVEWLSYENFGMIGDDILYTKDDGIIYGDKDEVERILQSSKEKAAYLYGVFD